MIRDLDSSYAAQLLPLLISLGYPDQNVVELTARMKAFLTHPGSWLFGLFEGDQLSGFSSLSLIPLIHENGYLGRISAISILRDRQGFGLGRLLVSHMEEHARQCGCVRMEVTSNSKRAADAHPFYLKMGYEKYSGARFVKSLCD